MKKYLFIAAAAVAVLAGCAKSTVVDVAGNRAIEFDQFVNKNTRAVEVVKGDLTSFYVIGYHGTAVGTYDTQVFKNELQNTPYYWVQNKFYTFAAYSNGKSATVEERKITGASFDANSGILSFTDYQIGDNDLVAAVTEMATAVNDPVNQTAVGLSFKHMLSQVKFTFTTTDKDDYTIKISNLTIKDAVRIGTGTLANNGNIAWTSKTTEATGDYDYPTIDDIATPEQKAESESVLVMPQDDTGNLIVSFDATISGVGMSGVTKSFTANLDYNPAELKEGTSENTWTPGFRYNYTAEITGSKILGEDYLITFTVDAVEGWKDANDQTTTPDIQQ